MARMNTLLAGKQRKLPLLGVLAALAMGLPSAGLAVAGMGESEASTPAPFEFFTPASVDPELAARVAQKARERGIRFTPSGASLSRTERTVTVAVRVDGSPAQAISVRSAAQTAPGTGSAIAGIQSSRFNLGTARGYQSFARPQAARSSAGGLSLDSNLSNLSVPDLADFVPAQPTSQSKPSRLQPRIALEDNNIAGRSPNTLDASEASVDVGGSFRLSPNLNVTAGVRLSQERDRIDPLTSAVQDNQAVYVGTQIKF